MTMLEFFQIKELLRFKEWFRKEKRPEGAPPCPGKYGRGLKTDNEMVNCFAAIRVVTNYYKLDHPSFSVDWPSNPTKLTIAKRARKVRCSRTGKRESSLTLRNVVRAISSINEDRQAIYWLLFYTQCRVCEARAVLGVDYIFDDELEDEGYERGRIFIERSADSKGAEAEIRNTTKTGVDGGYMMPESVRRLIAEHCSHARFDPTLPLFRNPHKLAKGDIWTDDALEDTWRSALESLDLPWVPLYQSTKHTQVSALRNDGVPTDDIVEQCRWASSDMMSRYDTNRDQRRDTVTARLDSLRRAAMRDEGDI
jgi:hypothetical protein